MKKITFVMLAVVATIVAMVAANSLKKAFTPNQDYAVKSVGVAAQMAQPIAAPSIDGFVAEPKVTPDSAASAGYDRPAGSFLFGLSDSLQGNDKQVQIPAYTSTVWPNTSTDNYTDFLWKFPNAEITAWATSTDKDLVAPAWDEAMFYGFQMIASSATLRDTVQSFNVVSVGGTAADENRSYGSGNFDISTGNLTRADVYSNQAKGETSWKSAFTQWQIACDSAKVVDFTDFFAAPAHPYEMTTVKLWAYVTGAQSDVVYKLIVRKCTKNANGFPVYGDTIATATCAQADVKVPTTNISLLTFPLKVVNNGLEEDADLDINSSIAVTIENPSRTKVTYFAPFWMTGNSTATGYTSYLGVDVYSGSSITSYTNRSTTFRFGKSPNYLYCRTFMFQTDACFNYILAKDTLFTSAATGEDKFIVLNSSDPSQRFIVSQQDGSEVPEWLTYKFTDGVDSTGEFNNNVGLKLTTSPNTTTATRTCNLKITYPGAGEVIIKVDQDGSTGVKAVNTVGLKVAVSDGNFVITHPTSINAVKIYNVSGQLVAQSNLAEGTANVSAASLAHGVYMLRFNNNAVVKVVK